jgi:type III secretion protein T
METLYSTDSYLTLLLALPGLEPITILSLFFLTIGRLLPILAQVPFLGSKNVPMTIRMMFAIALVALFLPQNAFLATRNIAFDMTFISLMLKELLIGAILGFFASVPFYLAQMAGSIIDHQRGSSSLQVTDPTTQSQTGPIGILLNYTLIAIFFSLDGPFLFFDGLSESYRLLPLDALVNPAFFSPTASYWKNTYGLMESMFTLSVQLAAPALIGILLTDLFLGIANRLAPQVQIVFLGMALKSWVGIALLTAAWTFILQVLGRDALDSMKELARFIQEAGHFRL